MTKTARLGIGVAGLVLAMSGWGCEKAAESKPVADTAKKTVEPTKPAKAAKTDKKPSAEPANNPTKPASAKGPSTVPTVAEWNSASEVTVKGSTALNCETKMVREWLRVSCRGKNSTGGTPTDLKVIAGGGPKVFFHNVSGITSVVLPYVNGTNVKLQASWTNVTHVLHLWWPHGAPKPEALGEFKGAESPLNP